MADNRTEEKDNTHLLSGVGRIVKSIGNIFGGNGEDSGSDSQIPLDISFDIGEIPPIVDEEEEEIQEKEENWKTPFEESLKKILAILNTEETKHKFVDFII